MNSVKETNGNGSRTWYQDKKIRIRNTRIPDRHRSGIRLGNHWLGLVLTPGGFRLFPAFQGLRRAGMGSVSFGTRDGENIRLVIYCFDDNSIVFGNWCAVEQEHVQVR